MTIERQKLTPPQLAALWGIKTDKVIAWIRSGELRAINAATDVNGERPRFLIDLDDLEAFERRRQVVAPPKATPRKKKLPAGIVRHFS